LAAYSDSFFNLSYSSCFFFYWSSFSLSWAYFNKTSSLVSPVEIELIFWKNK
jgi:hypothetical protein